MQFFRDRPVRLSRDEAKEAAFALRVCALNGYGAHGGKKRTKHAAARLANALERRAMEDL